ncbi:unnamed protein product [Cylindrotheca closterium]|uniref:Uncharacterized protein n=1 Tax=Cylindrotheca closterium TaxID=2856 RepID=A0AAD2CUS5_9STRA|nr:unnamed protein product [Cylindrotheca closterium]
MKPNSLKERLKSSRTEISEMGDKNKRRLKKYLQATGNLLFQRSERSLLTLREQHQDHAARESEEHRVLRTTVIVEQTPEPGTDLEEEGMETSSENADSNSMASTKMKRKRGMLNKWVSKMMASNDKASPPPPPLEQDDDEDIQFEGCTLHIASLRSTSPLVDRKRSDGTVDTSTNSEKCETFDDDDTTKMMVVSGQRDCADTVDASTVVVSNKSNPVTRILCSMSEETTVREINAWRNAACDLLLL